MLAVLAGRAALAALVSAAAAVWIAAVQPPARCLLHCYRAHVAARRSRRSRRRSKLPPRQKDVCEPERRSIADRDHCRFVAGGGVDAAVVVAAAAPIRHARLAQREQLAQRGWLFRYAQLLPRAQLVQHARLLLHAPPALYVQQLPLLQVSLLVQPLLLSWLFQHFWPLQPSRRL